MENPIQLRASSNLIDHSSSLPFCKIIICSIILFDSSTITFAIKTYKNYYILKFIQNYNLTLYFLKYYKSRFNGGISILSSLIYSVFEDIQIKSH